ncbi:MAG TPA: type II toxin-antitoxin system RelE/ParE family toxin [Thermoleophilaceae bacterium]|nr:type II toxin-antitoxin system RelE/ParE family toxin [Thermoleophilaceae bacterium]
MPWDIEFTPEAQEWVESLSDTDFERVAAALDQLEEHGPALGRPTVDSIKGSRHSNMKELRSRGGHLRALFAFDPDRMAIVLVGGDKAGFWSRWYEEAIPVADERYDRHLTAVARRAR